MLDLLKKALPYSLAFSLALTLAGIPMERYHPDHMISEVLWYFVSSFLVCIVVYVLCAWMMEARKGKKQ